MSQRAIQCCLSNALLRKGASTLSDDTRHSQIVVSDVFMLQICLHRCSRASFSNGNNIAGLTWDNVLVDLSKSRESFFTPWQHLQFRCD